MAEWPESRISQGSGFVSARDIGCLSLWGVLSIDHFEVDLESSSLVICTNLLLYERE